MNTFYNVIWSEAKQKYVVVSELVHSRKIPKVIAKAAMVSSIAVASSVVTTGMLAAPNMQADPVQYDPATGEIYSSTYTKMSADGATVVKTERPPVYITTADFNFDNASNADRRGVASNIMIGKGATIDSGRADAPTSASYGSIAIGSNAKVIKERTDPSKVLILGASIAIGADAVVEIKSGTNLLDYATPGNLSYENKTASTTINNRYNTVTDDTGALRNVFGGGMALGDKAYSRFSGIAIGTYANAGIDGGTAIGLFSTASNTGAVSLGAGAAAMGTNAISIGRQAAGAGDNSFAVGPAASATGHGALALGAVSTATGEGAIAIGVGSPTMKTGAEYKARTNSTTASGKKSVALGSNASTKETAENAIAIGTNAEGLHAGAVAIGANAKTAVATAENTATVNGITYSGFQGEETIAAGGNDVWSFSVGDVGKERQIKNVAPGKISATSTDAINGSQLYLTQQALGNLAKTTATHLGGASKVNSDGTLTAPTYTVAIENPTAGNNGTLTNTANTVEGGLTNLNTYVNQGFRVLDNGATLKGTVTPGEAIQFVNGKNTVANVTAESNGITKVTFDVETPTSYSFKVESAHVDGGTQSGTAEELAVAKDETVKLQAGKNLDIKQEGKVFTYSLQKDLSGLDSVKVGPGTPGADGQPGKDGVSIVGPIGADGLDGKVGISGKDGKDAVSISGKDGVGHIGLTGAPGKDGVSPTADITVKDGQPGVNGEPGTTMTRIEYKDKDGNPHEVATLDDGMKYAGDNGQADPVQVIKKQLNQQLDILGGADKSKLSDNNIGVNNEGGKLYVKLAKELTGLTSATFTNQAGDTTVINPSGVTITPVAPGEGKGPVSLTKDGLNNGGNKITNVAPGTEGTDAVNLNQLNSAITNGAYSFKVQSAHVDGGTQSGIAEEVAVAKDETVKFQGGKNLDIKQEGKVFTYSLQKDLTGLDSVKVGPGTPGADGTPGKDGVSITGPTGAGGIDGQPGTDGLDGKIGISGKDGKDAVSMSGKDGVGTIGLTGPKGQPGKDGQDGTSAKIQVEYSTKGLDGNDGKDGESKTRIVYEKPDGTKEQVATLNDGLKFAGDNMADTVIDKKLNSTVEIVGGADKDKLTDNNIGVNATEDGKLKVQLAKELKDLTSAEFTNPAGDKTEIGPNGVTITPAAPGEGKGPVSLTSDGLNNGGNKITNVAAGTADTDAVNVSQLNQAVSASKVAITANGGEAPNATTGNVTLTSKPATDGGLVYDVKLADKVTLGTDPAKQVTVDGTTGEVKAGGVTVNKDGAGTVNGLTNKEWNPVAPQVVSGQAATEDQLKAVNDHVNSELANYGWNVTSAADGGTVSGTSVEKITRDELVTFKAGNNIELKQDGNSFTYSLAKDVTGVDTIQAGSDGKDGKPGVGINGKDGSIGINGKDGASANITVVEGKPGVTGKDGDTMTRIEYKDKDGNPHQVATLDDGLKFVGDDGQVIKKPLNSTVGIIGGADSNRLSDNNIGITQKDGQLSVQLAKDVKGIDSIGGGNTSISFGDTVKVTGGNLDMGGNTIMNLAPGKAPNDAVNVSQLEAGLTNVMNFGTREAARAGSHAGAMAALKPLQYDPLEPTQIMGGVAHYKGETAAAVGLAHFTHENTMFHVGVSVGGSDNMVAGGVSHKFGWSPEKKAIPERYQGGPISSVYVMQDEVTALRAENMQQCEQIEEQQRDIQEQKRSLELQQRNIESQQRDIEELKNLVQTLMGLR